MKLSFLYVEHISSNVLEYWNNSPSANSRKEGFPFFVPFLFLGVAPFPREHPDKILSCKPKNDTSCKIMKTKQFNTSEKKKGGKNLTEDLP